MVEEISTLFWERYRYQFSLLRPLYCAVVSESLFASRPESDLLFLV